MTIQLNSKAENKYFQWSKAATALFGLDATHERLAACRPIVSHGAVIIYSLSALARVGHSNLAIESIASRNHAPAADAWPAGDALRSVRWSIRT